MLLDDAFPRIWESRKHEYSQKELRDITLFSKCKITLACLLV